MDGKLRIKWAGCRFVTLLRSCALGWMVVLASAPAMAHEGAWSFDFWFPDTEKRIPDEVRKDAKDKLDAGKTPVGPIEVILGPDARIRARRTPALPPLGPNATCIEMYNRVTALEKLAQPERKPFFQDPATAAFLGLGLIARPAPLMLGVSAYARGAERQHVQADVARIRVLRQRMGDLRCFVR
ncbi:MAG: hypothetical protein AAF458_12030 [Pseudomonadota bacterium]